MKAGIITLVFTLAILIGGVYFIYEQGKPKVASAQTEKLAVCLADKGVTMYGAYWCPHCKAQKEAFGSAVEKIKYVECTQETQVCTDKKVDGYPTWIFPDNTRLNGEQPLATLAQKAGCEYSEDGTAPQVQTGGVSGVEESAPSPQATP